MKELDIWQVVNGQNGSYVISKNGEVQDTQYTFTFTIKRLEEMYAASEKRGFVSINVLLT